MTERTPERNVIFNERIDALAQLYAETVEPALIALIAVDLRRQDNGSLLVDATGLQHYITRWVADYFGKPAHKSNLLAQFGLVLEVLVHQREGSSKAVGPQDMRSLQDADDRVMKASQKYLTQSMVLKIFQKSPGSLSH